MLFVRRGDLIFGTVVLLHTAFCLFSACCKGHFKGEKIAILGLQTLTNVGPMTKLQRPMFVIPFLQISLQRPFTRIKKRTEKEKLKSRHACVAGTYGSCALSGSRCGG